MKCVFVKIYGRRHKQAAWICEGEGRRRIVAQKQEGRAAGSGSRLGQAVPPRFHLAFFSKK
ncbi:MAG: hypothetical protein LBG43_05955 [Treponema sp.]|nr:hypothetical protein [Treponema sp.]